LVALTVVDSNCPSKSPVRVFKSGLIDSFKFPFNFMVEFNFPFIIPASGASF
jgi:hypothetical protein